jgi:hypothetical protein
MRRALRLSSTSISGAVAGASLYWTSAIWVASRSVSSDQGVSPRKKWSESSTSPVRSQPTASQSSLAARSDDSGL